MDQKEFEAALEKLGLGKYVIARRAEGGYDIQVEGYGKMARGTDPFSLFAEMIISITNSRAEEPAAENKKGCISCLINPIGAEVIYELDTFISEISDEGLDSITSSRDGEKPMSRDELLITVSERITASIIQRMNHVGIVNALGIDMPNDDDIMKIVLNSDSFSGLSKRIQDEDAVAEAKKTGVYGSMQCVVGIAGVVYLVIEINPDEHSYVVYPIGSATDESVKYENKFISIAADRLRGLYEHKLSASMVQKKEDAIKLLIQNRSR